MQSVNIEDISNSVYSIYLDSLQQKDKSFIIKVKEIIKNIHNNLSKSMFKADENVELDSITSLQVKIFNSFIRELAKGNSKQCEMEFRDYLQQVFRNKKVLNQAEILQVYSMCEGFNSLVE
ncbi:hypothetical protein M3175_21005 [Robertmurraya korlensis]|uniref:hypothetical protein n=1 Tax=Robertmurraya korlensis TaxID=519977 RepID=UPI00203C019C|nr:hypothetical protein [Robertmurraya korlensis]MCM3603221.1 hypothetical protein [Robertmurraya korlensis]